MQLNNIIWIVAMLLVSVWWRWRKKPHFVVADSFKRQVLSEQVIIQRTDIDDYVIMIEEDVVTLTPFSWVDNGHIVFYKGKEVIVESELYVQENSHYYFQTTFRQIY